MALWHTGRPFNHSQPHKHWTHSTVSCQVVPGSGQERGLLPRTTLELEAYWEACALRHGAELARHASSRSLHCTEQAIRLLPRKAHTAQDMSEVRALTYNDAVALTCRIVGDRQGDGGQPDEVAGQRELHQAPDEDQVGVAALRGAARYGRRRAERGRGRDEVHVLQHPQVVPRLPRPDLLGLPIPQTPLACISRGHNMSGNNTSRVCAANVAHFVVGHTRAQGRPSAMSAVLQQLPQRQLTCSRVAGAVVTQHICMPRTHLQVVRRREQARAGKVDAGVLVQLAFQRRILCTRAST